jgi:hypothetical protein
MERVMTRQLLAIVLSAAVATAPAACATANTQAARGIVVANTDADALIHSYIRQLPVGSRVRVGLADGTVIRGTLIKAQGDPIAVQRRTRIPEPPLEIPLKSVRAVELEKNGNGPGRAIAIGAAAGAGAALGVLLVLAAIFAD